MAHLSPRATAGQTVLRTNCASTRSRLARRGARRLRQLAHLLSLQSPHEALDRDRRQPWSDHGRPAAAPAPDSETWMRVREPCATTPTRPTSRPPNSCTPRPYVPRDDAFAPYARKAFSPKRPLLEACEALMARIHQDSLRDRQHRHQHPGAGSAGTAQRRVPGLRPHHDRLPAQPGPAGALCERLPAHPAAARPAAPGGRRRLARLGVGLRAAAAGHWRAGNDGHRPGSTSTPPTTAAAGAARARTTSPWPSAATSATSRPCAA
jgi:hypothetical protein